jgi:DNA polymerase/3'-5' exonuclease PolX
MTVFVLDDDGNIKGHAKYETAYLKRNAETVEVKDSNLPPIFEAAVVTELEETGESIEAAIENPRDYLDFLTYEDGDVVFDDSYVREDQKSA